MKFIFFIMIMTLISCLISEPDINSGTYQGFDDLYIQTSNDMVRTFSLNIPSGKLSINGYWDIINDQFQIESFTENSSIVIIGIFDTDSTVYGDWEVDGENGSWQGKIFTSTETLPIP